MIKKLCIVISILTMIVVGIIVLVVTEANGPGKIIGSLLIGVPILFGGIISSILYLKWGFERRSKRKEEEEKDIQQ